MAKEFCLVLVEIATSPRGFMKQQTQLHYYPGPFPIRESYDSRTGHYLIKRMQVGWRVHYLALHVSYKAGQRERRPVSPAHEQTL